MATRRVYKQPRAYRDGGRVPTDETVTVASAEVPPPSSPSPSSPRIIAEPETNDAIAQAIAATRRAEEIQRAQAQPSTVEQYIDQIEGLSDAKRKFLKEHPSFVTDPGAQNLLRKHYHAGIAAGMADDTEELNQHILDGIARDLERARQESELVDAPLRFDEPARPPSRPAPPPAPPTREARPAPAPQSCRRKSAGACR